MKTTAHWRHFRLLAPWLTAATVALGVALSPRAAQAQVAQNEADLKQAVGNLENQSLSLNFTKQGLLPEAAVFGLVAGSGGAAGL